MSLAAASRHGTQLSEVASDMYVLAVAAGRQPIHLQTMTLCRHPETPTVRSFHVMQARQIAVTAPPARCGMPACPVCAVRSRTAVRQTLCSASRDPECACDPSRCSLSMPTVRCIDRQARTLLHHSLPAWVHECVRVAAAHLSAVDVMCERNQMLASQVHELLIGVDSVHSASICNPVLHRWLATG